MSVNKAYCSLETTTTTTIVKTEQENSFSIRARNWIGSDNSFGTSEQHVRFTADIVPVADCLHCMIICRTGSRSDCIRVFT